MQELQSQQPVQQPIVLTYWKLRGLAQPIRHLLEYLGAKYVEVPAECPVKYFNEDIKEVKKKCVSTNLPLINDNGFFVTEPIAIVKYLCRKYGRADLLGETIIDECKIDEMFSRFVPHRNKMCDKFNTHVKGEDSPMTKQSLKREINTGYKADYVKAVSKILQKSQGGWYLGYLSIADFFLYETTFYMQGLHYEEYVKHKEFSLFKDKFQAIPEIKAYQTSDRDTPTLFMHPLGELWTGNPKYK